MEKSKLGISLNLFAALLYFIGVIDLTAVVIAAGYVLFIEASEKLKRTAVKALILTVFLAIVVSLLNSSVVWLSNILGSLNISAFTSGNTNINFIQSFNQITAAAISQTAIIIKIIVLAVFAFRAYKIIDVPVKWIDKILDRHLG